MFTIPLVHLWLLLRAVLGLGGRAEPYSYSKLTCVSESNPEVKCKLRKLNRLARGLVWVLSVVERQIVINPDIIESDQNQSRW